MTNNVEQSKNSLWWILENIKTELSSFFDKIKNTRSDLLKSLWLKKEKETQEVVSQTQKELNDLAQKIISVKLEELEDKKIKNDIEWNINDETTILWMLARNNEDIKAWFKWIEDVDDEDTKSREIETILLSLKEISKDGNDDSKSELTEQELKELWEKTKNKMELLDEVLKSEDIKNLPDDKKTKTEILKVYNELLNENNWDISKITKDAIITKLKEKSENNDE